MTARPNPDPLYLEPEDERALRWELRGRMHAALQELEVRPVDWEAVRRLLEGAVEAIEAAA